ncbi:MAG: hypothetical protein HY976_02300 [Candidatus Kerfeldbacteria bacterium]|nr:hypothetical protein [Candidatus Kerfeldbacteria bacterium]
MNPRQKGWSPTMSESNFVGRAAESVTGLGNKIPVIREGLIMEGLEWLNSAGFKLFADKFPQQAKMLHDMAKHNSVGTRLIFGGVGELARHLMGVKDPNDIRIARIADFLVAAQNMIRIGPDGESASATDLQRKLLSLPNEQSGPLIKKLNAMEPSKRIRLFGIFASLNETQIVNVLTMEDETLDMLFGLGQLPPADPQDPTKQDPIMKALSSAADHLKQRANRS